MAYPKGTLPYIEGQPIITLKEAREQGLSRYFTGVPCKHGHLCERDVGSRVFIQCRREKFTKWQKTEHGRAYKKAIYKADPVYHRAFTKRWQAKNTDKKRAYSEQYYSNPINRERRHFMHQKWAARNLDYYRAKDAQRRAQKQNATPWWADLDAIRAIYAEMLRLNKETGIAHHVDHIVPLVSKKVCGLHVSWNLRIVTATENMKKHNRLLEDIEMEEEYKARQLTLFG